VIGVTCIARQILTSVTTSRTILAGRHRRRNEGALMCNGSKLIGVRILVAMAIVFALAPAPASADTVSLSIVLSGSGPAAFSSGFESVSISSPDFSVGFDGFNAFQPPAFCFDGCGTGTSVPFTQTIQFDGRNQNHFPPDISGNLTFTGPTETLVINPPFGTTSFSEPVQFSGTLHVGQPNQFDERISGSGTGSVAYVVDPLTGVAQLLLFQYQVTGTAVTPEPASLILLGTSVAWLVARRRRAALSATGETHPTH